MVFESGNAKRTAIIYFVAVVLVIVLIYSFYKSGTEGVWGIVKTFLIVTAILAVLFLILYIGYKIFFSETKINLVENDRKDIIEAGTLCKPPMLNDLYFTGDKEHGESKIGHITGYCQIQSYEHAEEGVAKPEDCFVFKKFGGLLAWFEQPKVLRCYPEEHSQLIGDVRVYAISPIFKYGYYFPNHTFLNVRRIDDSVVKEAYRGQLLETLKDLVTITRRASGLDAEQKKQLEYRKLLKIPSSMGEEENKMGER